MHGATHGGSKKGAGTAASSSALKSTVLLTPQQRDQVQQARKKGSQQRILQMMQEQAAVKKQEEEKARRRRREQLLSVFKRMDKEKDVKLLVRRQCVDRRGQELIVPRMEEKRVTLADVDTYTPPGRRMMPCGEENCFAKCCGSATSFALGLLGAAAPFEALRILVWDPSSSRCCDGTRCCQPDFW